MNKQHSEEDIQKALRYLRIHHPDKANRKQAIKLLDTMENFAEVFVETATKKVKEEKKK